MIKLRRNKQKLSLILAMLIAAGSVFVPNISATAETGTDEQSAVSEQAAKNAEAPPQELKETDTPAVLKESQVKILSEKGIESNNFTERLYDKEEDLNTIIYRNKDGAETAYIFEEAVKYIDDNGEVKDKSNELSSKITDASLKEDYAYVNDQNDINTFFPKELKSGTGVVVGSDGVSIEMYPNTNQAATVSKQSESLAVYDDVFAKGIQLQYEPTYEGYKENIVLQDGKINKFSFTVEAENSYLEEYGGGINIVDEKTKKTKATISPIYVYDSLTGDTPEGETHYTYDNDLEFSKVSDGKYEITVTVSKEFLSRDTTIYPVYVDPSVTIKGMGPENTKAIIDLPMYNGSGASKKAMGANTTGVIGYVDGSYGKGRMLMKFPSLGRYNFMKKHTITSARLYLTDVSGQSTQASVTAYYYTGVPWTETGLYSSAAWAGVGSQIGGNVFSYPDHTKNSLNLTSAFKKWQTDTASRDRGIILKNATNETSASYHKSICTSEHSSKPYLVVSYFYNGCRKFEDMKKPNGEYDMDKVSSLNCMAYAFDVNKAGADKFDNMVSTELANTPHFLSSVPNSLNATKAAMEGWLKVKYKDKWHTATSYKENLKTNEWLVCMRVGADPDLYYTDDAGNLYKGLYDYHFWYRANDGKWYNKHGEGFPECVNGVLNPSTANTSSGWSITNYNGFYSSETLYYVVSK